MHRLIAQGGGDPEKRNHLSGLRGQDTVQESALPRVQPGIRAPARLHAAEPRRESRTEAYRQKWKAPQCG